MNRTLYFVVFLLSFLFFLASAVPASYLQKILGEQSGIQLSGISGSLWSGSATEFQLRTIPGKNLHWSVNFFPLLMGKMSVDINIDDADRQLQGTIAKSFNGTMQITDLTGNVLLVSVAKHLPNPLISQIVHGGRAVLAIDEIELDAGLITYLAGNMQLEKLQLAVPKPVDMGSLSVQLSNNEKGIVANIQDQADGALFLQAQASFMADSQYLLRGLVGTRDPKAVEIQNWLRVLGRTDAEGRYPLNFSGKLY